MKSLLWDMIGVIHFILPELVFRLTLTTITTVIILDTVNSHVLVSLKTDGLNLLMKEKMLPFFRAGQHKTRQMIGFK